MTPPVGSAGLRALRDYLASYVTSPGFTALASYTRARKTALRQIRYCIRISGGRVEVSRCEGEADYSPGSLMLFNESFAGTNEREGAEIGRQIVGALLEAGITVHFVTHRYELARHFRDQHAGATLFVRAEREPDGSRSYRLAARDPLPTSYGEDLYYQHGRWHGEAERTGAAGRAATGSA